MGSKATSKRSENPVLSASKKPGFVTSLYKGSCEPLSFGGDPVVPNLSRLLSCHSEAIPAVFPGNCVRTKTVAIAIRHILKTELNLLISNIRRSNEPDSVGLSCEMLLIIPVNKLPQNCHSSWRGKSKLSSCHKSL